MSKVGRRYRIAVVATLILLLAVLVAAVYGAWQIAAMATALLVALSIVLSLEARFRQGADSSVLLDVQRSLTDVRSALAESVAAHERTREVISSAHREASEQAAGVGDAIRRDVQHARKLEGERHARTRKALAGLMGGIDTTFRDQSAALLTGADMKERRLLGVLESERVRMHDRHQEVLRLLGRQHADDGEETSA